MSQTSYFANACGFVIENGNFSTVHGNQIIHNNQRIYHGSRKRKRTEYDDYNQVISGNIRRTKDFGVCQWYDRGAGLRVDKTICAAEVIGVEGKTFTVVAYSGPDAREKFERDFQEYSSQLTASSFQVYGVNANVPLVLFHNELRPLASFVDSLGFWGRFYLVSWMEHLDPYCGYHEIDSDFFKFENIPSDIELLQDDICFRFLVSLKSKDVDEAVVRAISVDDRKYLYGGPDVHQPTVFSISTNATIAVCTVEWRITGFEDREAMENGESRFTLGTEEGLDYHISGCHDRADEVWLTQASSVFHALGISLDSDLSNYKLITPDCYLSGHLSRSQEALQRRRQQPIYLFVVAPPELFPAWEWREASSLHYWSFDLSGQPPLSTATCNLLGLPDQLSFYGNLPDRYSWSNTAYKQVHDYQIARGFDPTTPDFARSLGYHIYQVQHDSHRFKEVAEAATAASSTTFSDVTPAKEVPSKPSNINSNPILSTLVCSDPTLEALYAVFASDSNTISPESTSNSCLDDWSTGYSQQNTQPPPLLHGVSPPFNNQPLHATGASAFAYTMPIHSHASHADFDFPFAATHQNDYTGWNPNLLWSGLPYGQYLLPPPPISSLGPPAASSLPFISCPNTSEALLGWNATDTPSLKRKERDMFHPDVFLQGNTKRARLLETSESDAISRLWPAQEANRSASSSHLEGDVAAGVQGTQPYGSSEGMGRPVTQTNKPEDEIRQLREENERLRRMLEISGSKNAA
ncbi:hypothetical protein V5O48_017174 [Marasmius crinis-equi]|uniref:Uncharacterized protein n=1 Tax=Marasmius crinis-equi TaxID=585013 RepID=A0ABR3EPQ1_9AGAR